ncbi:unnamed protein product [Tenebrio molitor]|nr:unnamed protein product [Tenebrio molitor]
MYHILYNTWNAILLEVCRATMGHMHKPLANAFTCISER